MSRGGKRSSGAGIGILNVVGEVSRRVSQQVDLGDLRILASSQSNSIDAIVRLEAMFAAAKPGEKLYVPPGLYRVSRTLNVVADNLDLDFAGILAPFGSFAGPLVRISPSRETFPFGGAAQGNIWQARTTIRRLTIDGGFTASGIVFDGLDHFDISRVYIRRCKGFGAQYSRCREGETHGLKIIQTIARGATDAALKIEDMGPGDANNTLNFYGTRLVYLEGCALRVDSPYRLDPGSGPGSAARFIHMYGSHVEGYGEYNASNVFGPTLTNRVRVDLRNVYGFYWSGGTLNVDGAPVGEGAKIVEVGQDGSACDEVVFDNTSLFGAATSGIVFDLHNVTGFEYHGARGQIGAGVALLGGPGAAQYQDHTQNMRVLTSSLEAGFVAKSISVGAFGASFRSESSEGRSSNYTSYMVPGAAGRAAIQPNSQFNQFFVFDTDGHIHTIAGAALKLGGPDNPVGLMYLEPLAAAPISNLRTGMMALADNGAWKPLAGAPAGPVLVIFNGTVWVKA